MLKEVKIELTNKCSRNCMHCSSNATSNIKNLKQLNFEDVCKIIKQSKQVGVQNIVFTGGEPLMYDKLPELVELTSKLEMKSTIYTFAYRTDETLDKYRNLINLGLNKIIYSLADSLSNEEDISAYDKPEFFDKVFENNDAKLGFHYTVSKDSFPLLEPVVNETIHNFKNTNYFDKVSLLRFVPHGKGTTNMDLTKEELLAIKNFYLNSSYKDKIRLGTPWNILGIKNTPCIMEKRNKVYDLYWYFACERQNIFWKKVAGELAPWTDDKILQEYKFCNSYRVNDRVSQYLLKNVIYNGKKYSNEDMLFRILLFKLFNKESTWELLLNNFEDITLETFNTEEYSRVLENAISSGVKIYNDAYISCANKAFGFDRKHDNHLALLNKMFNEDKIQNKVIKCTSMEEGFNIIKSYPLIGNFMAYQLVTDINYSEVVNWREDEFTVAGPGSLRGIKKCFVDKGKMSNEDIIRYMYEHQDEEFKRLHLDFKRIGNRPLQLIDCQNIFCELDKYCRKAIPDLKSNRTKIKKHYIPKKDKIEYIYPPKWEISL